MKLMKNNWGKCVSSRLVRWRFLLVMSLVLLSVCIQAVAATQLNEEIADPTKPASFGANDVNSRKKSDKQQQDFKLSSILLSPRRRMAIINGKLLYIGDEIAGAYVIAIDKDSVVLQGVGGVVNLQLLPNVVHENGS